MRKEVDKYDLYVTKPAVIPLEAHIKSLNTEQLKRKGWLDLIDSYDDAREKLKIILEHKGNAYLVPVRYKNPLVSPEEARSIAMRKYEEYKLEGGNLGPLSGPMDTFLWWTFVADDKDAIAQGFIPGRIRISIDKLDKHIASQQEYAEWVKLSIFQN